MSVPLNKLSSVQVPDDLIEPYDREVTDLTDWQRGGIALSDASETLDYQNWSIDLVGDDVTVTPETFGSPEVLFTRPDIEELSLAFDNNMRPVVAFVQAGQAILYFFDPVINDYQFQDLPAGAITPRCVLDDTRPTQVQTSSVVVSYVYDNSLWLLDQRDRYTIPYNLTMVADGTKLDRMGMGQNFRLHWVFQTGQGGDFVLTLTGLQNGEARIGSHGSIGYTISPDNGTETVKWSGSFDPVLPATYGTGPNPTDFSAGDGSVLYLHVTDSGIVVTQSAPIRYAPGSVAESALGQWVIDDDVLDVDLSADFSVPNLTGSYVISGLPSGVLDDGDGTVSGTPTGMPGTALITATFTDQYGRNVIGSYSVDVEYRPQAVGGTDLNLGFPEDSPIPATDLTQNWTKNGNTLTFVGVMPNLPIGLAVDSAGIMTGTPTTPTAPATHTFEMEDEYGRRTSDSFTLEIDTTAFTIALTGLDNNEARPGDTIGYTINPDSGTETVKWSDSSDPADPATYGTGPNPTDFTAGDGGQLHLHVTDNARTVSKSAPIRYAPGSVTESVLADWVIDDDALNVDLSADFSTPNLTGTYVITGLPSGVVDDGDGTLSGTPDGTPETASITATFTDQYGRNIVGNYSVSTVYRAQATAANSLPTQDWIVDDDVVDFDCTTDFTPNGNTLSYTIAGLPNGLTDDGDGSISGTPTQNGQSGTVTITATDEYGRATTSTFTFTTAYRSVAVGGTDLDLSFSADEAITATDLIQNWTDNGNTLSFFSVSPSLPAGLSIDSAGLLTGTPTDETPGTTYTLTMQDEYGRQTSDTFTLEVTVAAGIPEFTLDVRTTESSETVTLGIKHPYDLQVDWGDGNQESLANPSVSGISHQYAAPGTYTVKMTGNAVRFRVRDGDQTKIVRVRAMGTDFRITGTSMTDMFKDASNLTSVDSFRINSLSGPITSMSSCFYDCRAGIAIDITGVEEVLVDGVNLTGFLRSAVVSSFTGSGNIKPSEMDTFASSMPNIPSGLTQWLAAIDYSQLSRGNQRILYASSSLNTPEEYDAILARIRATRVQVNPISWDFRSSTYTVAGEADRQYLIDTYGDTFSDGGLA